MKHRILYIVRSLEIGGLEKVVVMLANNLDREQFKLYICCISQAGALADTLNEKDNIFVIGNEGRINISSIKYIYTLINKYSIDLVHSHNIPGLLYGFPAAKLGRTTIIHTRHGYGGGRRKRKIIEWIEKLFSRHVSEYICVSKELEKRMKLELGLKNTKSSFIYNGIEMPAETRDNYQDNASKVIIGSVGRLTSVKNYNLLISAFDKIRDRYPECQLEIVGDGECKQQLGDLIEQKTLSSRVKLHGYQLDVAKYLNRFDIFVLPSFYEGHSISLLEALSRSKICVVSNVGGNTEIIEDGSNGFIFESGNKNDLISKLSYILDQLDSENMGKIRKNAFNSFQLKYSVQTMVGKYEELYRKHLNLV